jgi:hypothetical protein
MRAQEERSRFIGMSVVSEGGEKSLDPWALGVRS